MARPSKLTPEQWSEVKRRILAGEKPADLAREFKVSRATISTQVYKRVEEIKAVANQMVGAEQSFRALPISEQLLTATLAQELIAISHHVAGAAKFGAATAHRLAGIAHGKVHEIDDAAPLDAASLDALKGVSALTRLANDSASIALNLLAANKERVKAMDDGPTDAAPELAITVTRREARA